MPIFVVFLLLGLAVLLGLLLWRGEGPPRAEASGQGYADPFAYRARPALPQASELFYLRLREAVSPDFDVWAGTPVVDLVTPRDDAERAKRPRLDEALDGLRTDFAIVRAAEVVAVVELEGSGRQARRAMFQDAVLRQCGYRVLRFDPRTGVPKVAALRDWLGPVLRS